MDRLVIFREIRKGDTKKCIFASVRSVTASKVFFGQYLLLSQFDREIYQMHIFFQEGKFSALLLKELSVISKV